MRYLFVLTTLCLFAVCQSTKTGCAQANRAYAQSSSGYASNMTLSDTSHFNSNGIRWYTSLHQAKIAAAKENKPLLLHFWGKQCRPCLKLEAFVFNNPQVIRAFQQNVIAVKIEDAAGAELFAHFGVRKMPTDIIVDLSGKVIFRRPSPQNSDGYIRLLKSIGKLSDPDKSRQRVAVAGNKIATEVVQKRDQELQRQLITKQGKSFKPNADGIVYHRSPNQPNFNPGGRPDRLNVDAPKVAKPRHSAPTHQAPIHEMPQVDPKIVRQLNKNQRAPANSASQLGNNLPLMPRESKIKNQFAKDSTQIDAKPTTPKASMAGKPIANTNSRKIKNEFVVNRRNQPRSISYTPAIDGFCPVSLLENKSFVRGDKDWGCFHRGKLFLFADKSKRDQFMKDPDTYFPALAGMDPVVYDQQGREVNSGIVTGLTVDLGQRKMMVLFSSVESKAEFNKNRKHYLDLIRKMEIRRSVFRSASQTNVDSGKIRR